METFEYRLPEFDENVRRRLSPFVDTESFDGVLEELLMFSCPMCGHITLDHSWTPDDNDRQRCLIGDPSLTDRGDPRCECVGDFSLFLDPDGNDIPWIIEETDEHIKALAATLV